MPTLILLIACMAVLATPPRHHKADRFTLCNGSVCTSKPMPEETCRLAAATFGGALHCEPR